MFVANKSAKAIFLKAIDFCFYRNNENNRSTRADIFLISVVLYDRKCPVCQIEMERLKKRDSQDRLVLLDINSPAFCEQTWGVSYSEASQALHVLTADNHWLVGMPAVRHVYQQVGLGWLLAPSSWPVLSTLFNRLYRYIAGHRYAISRWSGLTAVSHCTKGSCANRTIKQEKQ